MTSIQKIVQTLEQIPENELIFASKLYATQLSGEVTESTYYKSLERLCQSDELCKIAKGIYYRPKENKYGVVPPSLEEIMSAFTEPDKGVVVGYSLYNSLKLTTQFSKTVEVYSSQIEQRTKKIGNIHIRFCDLKFTSEVKSTFQILDILQNFNEIQDLNYRQFLTFCELFSAGYDEDIFELIYQHIRYSKRTILILEVKNYKKDIIISEAGQIYGPCNKRYSDKNLGEQMNVKRFLFRSKLEAALAAAESGIPVHIESWVVFSDPNISVTDLYRQERYCFKTSLSHEIDGFQSDVFYSADQIRSIAAAISEFADKDERYDVGMDFDRIRKTFAQALVLLESEPLKEETQVDAQPEIHDEIHTRLFFFNDRLGMGNGK